MKTIQQLLELAKNPYYKFTANEKAVLDDFLSQRLATDSKTSPEKSSSKSSEKTPVIVRNVVQKADTYPPETPDEL